MEVRQIARLLSFAMDKNDHVGAARQLGGGSCRVFTVFVTWPATCLLTP